MAVSKSSSFWFMVTFLLVFSPFKVIRSEKSKSEEDLWRESDRVSGLPGQPAAKFEHYAGYVRLREVDEKALFYWFFEAEEGVSEKPLVLWLNGGPGCSSIAYGAAQELGPFLVGKNGSELVHNPFAWNKVANVLFLEAPVGVGFSYTNNSEDLAQLGDRITADDSYAFLIKWFQRFPSFKSHEFYIAGESYAGHYVPQLAELIFDRNKQASKDSHINFKGIMIGNAVINDETDQIGFIDFAWTHGIISDQLYHTILKECDFKIDNQTIGCNSELRSFLQAYSDIDIYSIYTPVCLSEYTTVTPRKLRTPLPRFFYKLDPWHQLPSGYDPCTEDDVEKYFNRADVQKALHANVTTLSYQYSPCSRVISRWNDSPSTILPTLRKLINGGLRVWVFSGDTDGRVPLTSTRYSLNAMGLTIKDRWRAWFHDRQVAGWVVAYDGLTFATVRGAGHQVPAFAPRQSLSLFSHFLNAKTLPPSRF